MSEDLEYALKWVQWADAGFSRDQCPWKNPSEMKKHRPKLEVEARKILE